MKKIETEKEYEAILSRIEELLPLVDDNTPAVDRNYIELDILSALVEEYEQEHYPIPSPSLSDVIRLRMYEMGLTQKSLAELIGISQSRVSEILSGKAEPTLQIAKEIAVKLKIDSDIVLGIA